MFSQFLAQKILFLCWGSAPACFFGPKRFFFFFFKICQFLVLILDFFPNFWPKKSFFLIKLSPSLFFWPEKSFHFFFENFSIFGLYTQFSHIFGPKNPFFLLKFSPSLFFWPKKSFFFKLFNFWPKKILFFLLKLSPSFVFCPKMCFFVLFFWKLVYFWPLPPTESRKSYQSVNPSSVRAWWDFPCWVKLSHRLRSWWCPSVNF